MVALLRLIAFPPILFRLKVTICFALWGESNEIGKGMFWSRDMEQHPLYGAKLSSTIAAPIHGFLRGTCVRYTAQTD